MDERALIFSNLLNGVPVWQVARDFNKAGENEVMHVFNFVLRKIRSYRFERKLPPVLGQSIEEVRRFRITCLGTLPKLNLDREPKFARIIDEPIEMRSDGSYRNMDTVTQLKP